MVGDAIVLEGAFGAREAAFVLGEGADVDEGAALLVTGLLEEPILDGVGPEATADDEARVRLEVPELLDEPGERLVEVALEFGRVECGDVLAAGEDDEVGS